MNKKRVSIAIIENDDDKILFGFRDKEKKWSTPGGCLEGKESPEEGLIREVKEETGLDVIEAKLLCTKEEDDVTGYVFKVKVSGKVDPSKDPDKEAQIWAYRDIWDIKDSLYIPWTKNWAAQYWAGLL